ncbi:hypothetical protein ASD80_16595 [Devosia sp. Root635]|nr:hypothetical protein ASD80_16595 [Devosia sp. Root635]
MQPASISTIGLDAHPALGPLTRAQVNRLRTDPAFVSLTPHQEARAELFFQLQATSGLDDESPALLLIMELADCYAALFNHREAGR